jgi:hypothetical protein
MHPRPASAFRTVMITAAAGAVGLLAVGCRSGTEAGSSQAASTSQSPLQAITLAAHQAAKVNSFKSTLSLHLSGAVTGSMSGSLQMRKQPSVLEAADLSTLDINGHNLPGGMQEVATSSTIYLKMSELRAVLGKSWVAIPFSELQSGTGINLSQLIQEAQSNNPMVDAQMLAGASNLRSVGTQTVDGVTTTHYTGTFPVSAGLASLPSSLRGTVQKELQSLGVQNIGFNAWIDTQHQVRKLVLAEHGSSLQVTATMQVTSFNQPVSISIPPASQVKTIPASDLPS